MRKLSVFLVVLATLLSVLIIPVSASSDVSALHSGVIDRDDNLTADEEAKITDKLRSAEIETDIIFLIGIYDISEGIPTDKRVVSDFGLDTERDDIVLLIIEVGNKGTLGNTVIPGYSNNYYEMFTWGVANTVVTDGSVDSVLDSSDVHDNIKGGEFYSGIMSFTDLTVGCIKSYRRGVIILIIALAVLAAAGSVGGVLYTYKRKLKAPIYPLSDYATLKLNEHTDIFLGKTVTRTRISSSSGGSGGRSGGGGGGSRGRR